MKYIRMTAFVFVVLVTLGVVFFTGDWVQKQTNLGLDLKGGFEILYEASPLDPSLPVTKDSLNRTASSLASRINKVTGGVAEPQIDPEGANRIRVKLAVQGDQQKVREVLKKPAELTFRSGQSFETIELYGSDFKEEGANVYFDEANMPAIEVSVKDAAKLEAVTKKLQGQQLAIFLDNEMLTNPVVQAVISNGVASITGGYTLEKAKEIADTINLGALPLKLTEKYSQSVGATLGEASLKQTVYAGLIASIAILIFMLIFYRVPGFISAVSIIANIWLLLFVFNLLDATLTLPGIAAFILGIGMAVDANIITFERIKDELRSGKTIMSSLKAGSQHSLRTILDANITTIIAGLVLYFVGTGPVQGFALILVMSILVSMITNVLFSRFLMDLLVRANVFKKPGYFGVKESEISAL
jgi:preprotein translocase subunit SecD